MAQLFDLLLIGPLMAGLAMLVSTRHDGSWRPLWLQRAGNAGAVPACRAPLRLGPYTLGSKLGEGAMGEVYRAWNSRVGAWHALKLLPPNASLRDRQRFEKEARLAALVRHPNTVSIIEQTEERQGTCYYAMELLEGANLQQLVEQDGPLPAARVAGILAQLGAALEEMHVQGLVHRDIKPDNVILTGRERKLCKLIDFGLAEHVGALAQGQPEGALVGTPLYISPEAIVAPETVGPKSDLYGLGAVGYFLLRGEPVFTGKSVIEVCCHHLHSTPEPLNLATVDPCAMELERVLLECLAKDPALRPASAGEVIRRLECALQLGGLPSRRAEQVCLEAGASCPRAPSCRLAA